jgi:hypothetical protein
MPLFVVAALAVTLGLERCASWLPDLRHRRLVVPGVVGALVAGFAITQAMLTADSVQWGNWKAYRGIVDTPAFLIVYTEDRAAIGRAMEGCFRDDDFSIVGGAGAQPYYGRMRGIDVFGLVSDKIAHEVPRTRARSGHTKFASEAVVASFDPTFIFSCYGLHPTPTPANWNCAPSYWQSKGYEIVTMHIPELQQSGEYYSFLAKKSRNFECPGRVR